MAYNNYILARLFLVGCLFSFSVTAVAADKASSDPLISRITNINQLYTAGKSKQAEQLAASTLTDEALMASSSPALQLRAHLVYADLLSRRGAYVKQVEILKAALKKLDAWQATVSRESIQVRNQLAQAYVNLAREDEAIKTLETAMAHAKQVFPANDLAHVDLQLSLARIHTNRYEVDEAKTYLASAKQLAQAHKDQQGNIARGRIYQAEGELYFRMGRTKDAADTYQQALEIRKKILGDTSLETGQSIVSLASALKGLHNFSAAEEMYRSGFAIYEEQVGLEHPFVATLLNNIGQLYYLQGRYEDSEKVLLRALEIKRKYFSPDHISFAETLNQLGYLYYLQHKDKEAAKTFDEAIRIWSLPGYKRTRYRLSAEIWRSTIRARQGEPEKALAELQQTLKGLIDIYGEDSVLLANIYQEIGHIYDDQGKYQEAEGAYLAALKSASVLSEGDRLEEILTNGDLADLQARDGRLQQALKSARRSVEGMQKRIDRYSGNRAQALTTELKSLREAAITHVDVIARLRVKASDSEKQKLINESFVTAQISQSSNVAQALSRMAQRFAARQGPLAELVRQQQLLQARYQEIDGLLTSAIQKPAEDRNTQAEKALRQNSKQIYNKLQLLEKNIAQRFPDYAALAKPAVLSIEELQALLHDDEAVVLYMFGEKQGFAWTITPTMASLQRLDVNSKSISDDVKTLRSYLVPDQIASLSDIKPVPIKLAHRMYQQLLEGALKTVTQKNLIVIADGALQSLPLSVLVTELPEQPIKTLEDHKNVAWLVKQKAVSIMPDIGSIKMLRKTLGAQTTTSKSAYLGVGDPALKDVSKKIALRSKQRLSTRGATTLRSIIGANRAAVDIDVVASLEELPDTANELKTISKLLKGKKKDIYLREKATQERVEKLDLEQYRVIQFATHGLMAGDFQGLFEPALVLTPTLSNDQQEGDGLLTASEITELKMNADMVVLSACNTAAPDGSPGAEGMSGLGRAFFYAGGRSLMLTHWAVLSDAAVSMTTGMFDHMENDGSMNKAEAARRAKLDIINSKQKPYYAHPLFWAPFVIVGEAGNGIS